MSEITEKMKVYLDSEIGQAVLVLGAYTINATKTGKDNEIVQNVDEVIGMIADSVKKINDSEVTVQQAKDAAMLIIKKIAEATPTKWDDRIIPILDMFL